MKTSAFRRRAVQGRRQTGYPSSRLPGHFRRLALECLEDRRLLDLSSPALALSETIAPAY